ncbi:putative GPI anchored protein [Acephala macrosclerotiorum]|nr:putative GPI anchored protein [Acephala macrosclerotiorum]
MSYDGTLLDETTGLATTKYPFSVASKEALQIMLYTHALAGSKKAARCLSPDEPEKAGDVAFGIVELKLRTYLRFNETFPGFGGFLPWYTEDEVEVVPTYDWVNRVPALDNGELIWAVYSAVQVLETSPIPGYSDLAKAAKIFYKGNGTVTDLANQSFLVDNPRQNYSWEGSRTLNDPYEGELFTWWLYFFDRLSENGKNLLWEVKRPQLVSVEYNMGGDSVLELRAMESHGDAFDVDIVKRVFYNAERVWTCNSVVTKVPGIFASVNNSTDPTTGQIIGYISNAGIPSISNQTVQELDLITPYSVFPLVLFDKSVRMTWWKNMVDGKKMQDLATKTDEVVDAIPVPTFNARSLWEQ